MKKVLYILFGVVICLLVGFLSRLLHEQAMIFWYPTLLKSALTPPDIVLPIVWGVLYILMGISVGLLYNVEDVARKRLLWLFAIQLLFNVCWNYAFFYMQNPALGLVVLIILDALAVIFFTGALKVKKSSAYTFLPYMVWIFFATYLNLYILVNNWF